MKFRGEPLNFIRFIKQVKHFEVVLGTQTEHTVYSTQYQLLNTLGEITLLGFGEIKIIATVYLFLLKVAFPWMEMRVVVHCSQLLRMSLF